ncbi:hypothetical protein [Streptococcus dysgalactiae]|uniref:hypothetical protein n=1 Tax=Streptococcus dysgalactiae TaxID=1334 RepID=UPI003D9FBD64
MSVTESGGVEKSAQMSRLVAEDYKSDMKSSRSINGLKQWWYRGNRNTKFVPV